MKKIDFSSYLPLGFEWKYERRLFIGGIILSVLYGSLFFIRLDNAWGQLFELVWKDGKIVRNGVMEGAVMRDFVDLLHNALFGFLIVGLCMAAFVVIHYVHHYQGSKSIYVMKRLPDKWELHRRCVTLPLIGIVICLVTAFLFLLLCYGVYMKVTPPECIVGNQWQKLWSVWLG